MAVKVGQKCLENVLDKFEGMFKSMTEYFKKAFDDWVELKPMIGLEYEIKMKNKPIKPLHLIVPCKTPFALRDRAKAELDNLVAKGVLRRFYSTQRPDHPLANSALTRNNHWYFSSPSYRLRRLCVKF